jgi:pullulanase
MVERNGKVSREFIDPWSRCNTNTYGRGYIFSDDFRVSPGPELLKKTDAVIYELHIRDFTIDANSGISAKGKYLGLTERETRLTGDKEISTGVAHLVDLGINVVQLMPVQDFDNDEEHPEYNWGYMPVNFNSPEGWYATSLTGSSRVVELKKLVDALHKAGIKVTMDVVYNHTAENEKFNPWSFEILAPGRYYRLNDKGGYSNGSGCGNEFKSDAPPGREFILSSCRYWVKAFGVDGFRFDLMGLIDLKTMELIASELRKIKPDILIYGEPWTAGATVIEPTVKGAQKGRGFAVFNDNFRDAVKGSVFDLGPGYVQAGINIDRIKNGIVGSVKDFALNPDESINYVACHDNHTLWDRITLSAQKASARDKRAMDKMAAVLVLTSQGIPFIHSGQEFLRSKFGNENSYNAPDSINKIRWELKKKNSDIFSYYRGLIELRKKHPLFRFDTAEEALANVKFFDDDLDIALPEKIVAWRITRGGSGDTWVKALIILNPADKEREIILPKGKFSLFGNRRMVSVRPVSRDSYSDKIKIAPWEALILAEEE